MKRTLFISILIVFIISLVGCNIQTPTKELYDLQDKCGKRSQEYFKHKYGNGTINNEDEYSQSSYQCHYNKKLNKCFILILTNGRTINSNGNTPFYNKSLFDINENRELGFFYRTNTDTSMICTMGKICKNSLEWDELVEPYMKE